MMNRFRVGIVLICGLPWFIYADDIINVQLDVDYPGIEHAVLHVQRETNQKRDVVLVLFPGQNEDGAQLLQSRMWKEFAERNRVHLAAFTFRSPPDLLHSHTGGYFYPEYGSGALFLASIEKQYSHSVRLLLVGFSGGAHFVSRFVQLYPNRVIGFCAYSAAWWNKLSNKIDWSPPGIIACGDRDPYRYGATLLHFQAGRAKAYPWTWISIANQSHSNSLALDLFVSLYFEFLLNGAIENTWVDNLTEESITGQHEVFTKLTASWLPSAELLFAWSKIHTP